MRVKQILFEVVGNIMTSLLSFMINFYKAIGKNFLIQKSKFRLTISLLLNTYLLIESFILCLVADAVEETTELKKVPEVTSEAAAASADEEKPGQANSLEATEAKERRKRAPIGMATIPL
jgi:hypothetical protein